MKILTVVGARPQFVKAAVVSRAVANTNSVEEVIVHTGQHFDANMSDVFFEEMEIPRPDYNLEINSLSHGAMTGRMLEEIEKSIVETKPDWVLVYGDTNSTLAGALAARKLHVNVAHVEAGLRSFNMRMPEEVNRILTDRISNVLFCPTDTAVRNLSQEGYDNIDCQISMVGDVMYDAAMFYKSRSRAPKTNIEGNFVLATIHRAENTDSPGRIAQIIDGLNRIHQETQLFVPMHPRTKAIIDKLDLKPEFNVLAPVGYLEMVHLLEHCQMVFTDSGGLQKEAYFFSKPCVTIRDQTEWVELIEHKVNQLCPAQSESIFGAFQQSGEREYDFSQQLYGTGSAGEQIVDALNSCTNNS